MVTRGTRAAAHTFRFVLRHIKISGDRPSFVHLAAGGTLAPSHPVVKFAAGLRAMRQGSRVGRLRDRSADKAADAAIKLEKMLSKRRGTGPRSTPDDIVAIARESRAQTTEVATDAKAGRFAAATDANKKLNGRCSA